MSIDKTLYISDLDGTLLNYNAELSQYTKDTLNRMIADGLSFSVATARTAATSIKILEGIQWKIPLIFLNGALIFDIVNKRYVQILSLSAQTVAIILTVFKRCNVTGLMYQFSNNEQATWYESLDHKPLRGFIEERKARYNKEYHQTDNFMAISHENIVYFRLLDTYDKNKLVHDALSVVPGIGISMYKNVYNSDLWHLEIHNEKASKQNATTYLRKTYGFERIIGFGDNLNDLPLFAACDVRIAVENANKEVKATSDHICSSNNDDGVVKWIENDFNERLG